MLAPPACDTGLDDLYWEQIHTATNSRQLRNMYLIDNKAPHASSNSTSCSRTVISHSHLLTCVEIIHHVTRDGEWQNFFRFCILRTSRNLERSHQVEPQWMRVKVWMVVDIYWKQSAIVISTLSPFVRKGTKKTNHDVWSCYWTS